MIGFHWDEAERALRRAIELDSRAPRGRLDYALLSHRRGRNALELDPSFPIAHTLLGHIYMGTGRTEEAIRHYERVAEIVPNSFYTGFLGHAYARAGRATDARLLLSDLMARSDRGEYVSPGAIGWILLGLGERDDGFRWLERAAGQRDVFLTIYGVLTNKYLAETFRNDPRFEHIRTIVGLEP